MQLFGFACSWACCVSSTDPATESREDGHVQRDAHSSARPTPRPSKTLGKRWSTLAPDRHLLLARGLSGSELELEAPDPELESPRTGAVSVASESTAGPITPRMWMKEERDQGSDSPSSISAIEELRRLSPRLGLEEIQGDQPSQENGGVGRYLRKAVPPSPYDGHQLDANALDDEGRSRIFSDSSKASGSSKARSRSSSATEKPQVSKERSKSRASSASRSRLDQHLEAEEEVRRSSRASTDKVESTPSLTDETQGARHRTWSGPDSEAGSEVSDLAEMESEVSSVALHSPGSQKSEGSTGIGRSTISSIASRSRSCSVMSTAGAGASLSQRIIGSRSSSSADGRSRSSSGSVIKADSAVIIVDWDDTLCPTSWIFDQIRRCADNRALLAVERASAERLEEHANEVVNFLRSARSCAQVAIVTLATEEFFWQSSSTFLEGVHVKELFQELGIEVYFAERPAQMTFLAEVDAKKKAMNRCLSKVYGRKPMSRWNVLSVGDSEIEHEALKGLLASKWRSSLCKTLKFDSRPSLLQLTNQLRSVGPHLAVMMAQKKSFNATSHTKWT